MAPKHTPAEPLRLGGVGYSPEALDRMGRIRAAIDAELGPDTRIDVALEVIELLDDEVELRDERWTGIADEQGDAADPHAHEYGDPVG